MAQTPQPAPTLLCQSERPTWAHYKVLLLTWGGWMFDFYDLVLYSFLLIPIGKELALSREQLGWVLGTSLAATAIGGVVFGALADRYGRKPVLSATILTYSVGTLLSGLSTGFTSLLLFRIVTGLGVGGEWATAHTYVAETFPARVRGRFGAILQSGAPMGVALASAVAGFVQPLVGWRGCFLLSTFPALLVVFVRNSLPESDLWHSRHAASAKQESKLALLLSRAHRRDFILALVLATLDMTAYWCVYSWMPAYLQAERHMELAKSAVWMLVMQTGALTGYVGFGLIADWLGRRPAYSAFGVIWAAALMVVTIFWDAASGQPRLLLTMMFFVGFGTGMFGGYGPLFAELFPTSVRNTAMGAAFNLARGVQFLTPVVVAVIARHYGLAGGISLAALFALLTGAWIWVFPETKGKQFAAE